MKHYILIVGLITSSSIVQATLNDSIAFLRAMINNPTTVSAIAETSYTTGLELTQYIAKDAEQRILELGAGPGNITTVIMDVKAPSSTVDTIELDEAFCAQARKRLAAYADAGLTIHNASAGDWKPSDYTDKPLYDCVISTLPLTRLPLSVIKDIIHNIDTLLLPGGSFSFVTYIGSHSLGYLKLGDAYTEYCEKIAYLDTYLDEHFDAARTEIVLANIPPTYVYHWIKKITNSHATE